MKLFDVIAQSVGVVGPVFSVTFVLPQLVGLGASGRGAGAAAPLSVLIAAVGVLCLAWIVAQHARRIQSSGSLYDYVSAGLGKYVGAATGLLYYCGLLALGAATLVQAGHVAADALGVTSPQFPLACDLLLVAGLGVLLLRGVALSARAQLVLGLVSLIVVFVFTLIVILMLGDRNNVATAFDPHSSPQGISGVLFGVLYGVLLFTGFETAANLGEEANEPRRDIPRAALISVVVVAGFYLVSTYGQVAGYGFDMTAIAGHAESPLFNLAGPRSDGGQGSAMIKGVVELVCFLDMVAVLIGCAIASSRGLFAMARNRRLPAMLTAVGRRGSPRVASMFVLVVSLVVVLFTEVPSWAQAATETPLYVTVFSVTSVFGGVSLAVGYLLMCLGGLRRFRGHLRPVAMLSASLVGAVVTSAAIFGVLYKISAPVVYAPIGALVVFMAGLGFAVAHDTRRISPRDAGNRTASHRMQL